MLSSRVFKANTITVDRDNPVVIETEAYSEAPVDELPSDIFVEPVIDEEQDSQEKAYDIISNARQQAQQILQEAKSQAAVDYQAMTQRAKKEAADLAQEARTQGYNEGMTAAVHEGDTIRANAKKVLEDAEAQRIAMLARAEPDVVGLVMEITDKLLGNAVHLHPEVILHLVKQGMQSATIAGDVTVYVSSHDIETVQARREEILALTDGSVKLEIIKDLSLGPMDCVIETPFGNIDCSLGQQFEALKQNLTYLLNS